jgi:hypothetical protein
MMCKRSIGERLSGRRFSSVFVLLAFVVVVSCRFTPACAQTAPSGPSTAGAELPDAPQTAQGAKQSFGSISGSIIDVDGVLATGARVILTTEGSTQKRQATADAQGRFNFTGVPAGKFTLAVTSDGLEPSISSGVLHAGEDIQIPQIALRVATANTDVEVTLSQRDLAEAEIQTEEKQRLFGFAPNFFVAYTFNAAPLTPKQKWELSYKSIIDPVTIGISAAVAGIEQANNTFPGYGNDAPGYGKRFGANYGDVVIGTALGGYVFPVLFHQDPRYFYKGTGTKTSRFLYALSTSVIARGDNGKWQPAYASLAGDLSAAAISNVYYPASSRNGASLTIANGLLGIAFDGVGNVLQEFVFRKLSSHASKPSGATQ